MNKVSFKIFKEVYQESNTSVMPFCLNGCQFSDKSGAWTDGLQSHIYKSLVKRRPHLEPQWWIIFPLLLCYNFFWRQWLLKRSHQTRRTANPLLTLAKEKIKAREDKSPHNKANEVECIRFRVGWMKDKYTLYKSKYTFTPEKSFNIARLGGEFLNIMQ